MIILLNQNDLLVTMQHTLSYFSRQQTHTTWMQTCWISNWISCNVKLFRILWYQLKTLFRNARSDTNYYTRHCTALLFYKTSNYLPTKLSGWRSLPTKLFKLFSILNFQIKLNYYFKLKILIICRFEFCFSFWVLVRLGMASFLDSCCADFYLC